VEVIEAVLAMVRASTTVVAEPVMLRSTNNIVVWLSPTGLVAKIASDPTTHLGHELSWAHLLAERGAPVVPPAPSLGAVVHRIADRDVTLWEHVPQDPALPASSLAIAAALHDLHATLGEVAPAAVAVADRLETTVEALHQPSFPPTSRQPTRADQQPGDHVLLAFVSLVCSVRYSARQRRGNPQPGIQGATQVSTW
jgi:hypothetical protein